MHLKRYAMPRSWPVPVKGKFWVARPSPGPHAVRACVPLQLIVRDLLGLAATGREAKRILTAGKVLVDGKARGPSFPVGMMDAVTIPELRKAYRVLPGRRGLRLAEIEAGEAQSKLCQILAVTTVRGGRRQLHLHDGRNVLAPAPAPAGAKAGAKPGDTLLISVPEQKVLKHVPLHVGAAVLVTAGRSAGTSGTITAIRKRTALGGQSIAALKTAAGTIETRLAYVFAVPEGSR